MTCTEASSAKIRGIKYEQRQRCHNEFEATGASTSHQQFCTSTWCCREVTRNCVHTHAQLWQTATAVSMVSVSRKTAFLGLFLVICLSMLLCASAASSTANLKAQAKVSVLPDLCSNREPLSCPCTAAKKLVFLPCCSASSLSIVA